MGRARDYGRSEGRVIVRPRMVAWQGETPFVGKVTLYLLPVGGG